MIKALLNGKGGFHLLVLGFTEDNVERMRAGDPTYINLEELGIAGVRLAVLVGANHTDLQQQLRASGVNLPTIPEPQPGQAFRWGPGDTEPTPTTP